MKKICSAIIAAMLIFQSAAGAYPANLIDNNVSSIAYERDEWVLGISGWDIDRRGGEVISNRLSHYEIRDTSYEYPVILKRKIDSVSAGDFIYESSFNFIDLTEGFSISFKDAAASDVIVISADRNGWYANGVKVCGIEYDTDYRIKLSGDADAGKYSLMINGELLGEHSFLEDSAIEELVIATPESYECEYLMGYTLLSREYRVNERFMSAPEGTLSADWECLSGTAAAAVISASGIGDDLGLEITDGAVKTSFEEINGAAVLELVCRVDECDSLSAELGNVKLALEGGTLLCQEEPCTEYSDKVWQTLRVETSGDTTDFYLNGKKVKTVAITAGAVDELTVTASGNAYIDDVKIFEKSALPQDYPLMTASEALGLNDDTYIGMQACYLWQNGRGRGWDTLTPYTDTEPLLGYYDDGNPEVMDWELMWMAQHGVDYILPCVYEPVNYTKYGGGVIKPTNAAIHDGYFMSENSKYVKFALNLCSSYGDSVENFINYVIPFFCEYYFSDERYMTVDNKPLLYVWSPGIGGLTDIYGTDGMAEIIAALDEACIELGYDGIYMFAGGDFVHSDSEIDELKSIGYDYTFNYTTGTLHGDREEVQKAILTDRRGKAIDAVANISNGYNQRAWYKYKKNHAWMEPAEYTELLRWIKDEYMAEHDDTSLASKMLTIDNWNELGEGHFVQPTKLHGFGYLDAIREAFYGGSEHTDAVPSDTQKARLRAEFPEKRRALRYIRPFTGEEIPETVQEVWDLKNGDKVDFSTVKISNFTQNEQGVSGTAISSDPVINSDAYLAAKDIEYIHIRMKVSPDDTSIVEDISEVFFTTEEYPEFNQARAVGEYSKCGETVDVYYDMRENQYWKGTVTGLRFDVMTTTGSFNIEKIEFLGDDAYTAVINGEEYELPCPMQFDSEIMFVPVESMGGICSMLGFYVEYENDSILIQGDKPLQMTLGKNEAALDGEAVTLSAAPYLYRGAAMVPQEAFEYLGVEVSRDGMDILMSQQADETEILPVFENEWYFDTDTEGWRAGISITLSKVREGIWRQRSATTDPTIFSPDISISGAEYPYVEVRMANHDAGGVMQLFFNADDSGFGETNSVKLDVRTDTEGFCIYTFDMSQNDAWNGGTITGLRLDPVSQQGSYDIDYVRFLKKKEVTYTQQSLARTAEYTNLDRTEEANSVRMIIAFYNKLTGKLTNVIMSDEQSVQPRETVTFSESFTAALKRVNSVKTFVWKNGMIPCNEIDE
ncbi:MAG: hypothetical protein J6C82_04540 [Clostridia bacterium]|nr:hypothetical protein [Clostridia bacterium]